MSPDFSNQEARDRMVAEQLAGRRIVDQRVLQAMRTVPRHLFVPADKRSLAYQDRPLPIGQNQTISQPYIVALMTQLLGLSGDERVLEIGTGSGYQAAVLSRLAEQVYSIERHAALAARARRVLQALGYNNVHIEHGDGSQGLPAHAPYDGIIVTAAAPQAPRILLEQLAEGGCLVLPVGDARGQILQRWQRRGETFSHDDIVPVAFVPLRGRQGWDEQGWEPDEGRNG